MGISDELHYYDLYAPLVAEVELTFTPEEAQQQILDALRAARQRIHATWSGARSTSAGSTCFRPTGKRSGAYSEGGAYDVHPYMLLNYLGQYNDVSTLAHELGHTMHSYYLEHDAAVCAGELSDVRRGGGVDLQRGAAHRLHAAQNEGRGDAIVAARQLPREHQGHRVPPDAVRRVRAADAPDGGARRADHRRDAQPDLSRRSPASTTATPTASACVDDYVAHEWSYIPHFYAGSTCFSTRRRSPPPKRCQRRCSPGTTEARKRYLAFLASGTSKYPIELLKDAGVDMTTDEPLDLTMRKMNRVMDEIEEMLERRT